MRKVFCILALLLAGPLTAGTVVDTSGDTHLARATFAGGCFWCMEAPFEKLDGVKSVVSGYTDGRVKEPTYQQVCSGTTGHTEAVHILYDPQKVSYQTLLEIFWRQINPTQVNGQFVDKGTQYRTGIYYYDQEQKKLAEESKAALETSGKFSEPIATEIKPASHFYEAEAYHQDYYKTNPVHYRMYRVGSGRDRYLKEVWGDKD